MMELQYLLFTVVPIFCGISPSACIGPGVIQNYIEDTTEQAAFCSTWMFRNGSNQCDCGDDHNDIIRCNSTTQSIAVLDCYCVTYDEEENTTVAGACFTNCGKSPATRDLLYKTLPTDILDLNRAMCGHLSRTGPLCGQCLPDYFPLVYSFNLTCVKCPNSRWNWWKYILIAYLPLTVFYLFVLFFKINANSPHLHGLICLLQMYCVPYNMRALLFIFALTSQKALSSMKFFGTIYGIWNLDFFRTLLPDICLRTTTLQTLALDYAIALYPLVLVVVSSILIEMYDHNFRLLVLLWKPFRFVLLLLRRNWDVRTSVIDAYATFFLLSFVKILSVSADLLNPAYAYKLNSVRYSVVYYDGSIKYFSTKHLPYAILALVMLLLFVFLPILLLILYPFSCFQKCFTHIVPIRLYHIIRTFVDSFQGCFKDGTEPGTRDCRWFSAVFLVFRVAAFISFFFFQSVTCYAVVGVITAVFLSLLIQFQPYKSQVAQYSTCSAQTALILLSGLLLMIAAGNATFKDHHSLPYFYVGMGCITLLPSIYMACIVIQWIFSRRKWGREMFQRFNAWRRGYGWWGIDEDDEGYLPYQLLVEGV